VMRVEQAGGQGCAVVCFKIKKTDRLRFILRIRGTVLRGVYFISPVMLNACIEFVGVEKGLFVIRGGIRLSQHRLPGTDKKMSILYCIWSPNLQTSLSFLNSIPNGQAIDTTGSISFPIF
jgi:hypothetical protein